MMSSRLEIPTHTTGAPRAHRRAARPTAQRPPARYEPYLDGLFTYCLSVLCHHDAAADALGAALAIADRQDARGPTPEEERQSWLYALARWACLRTLAERARGRRAHRRRPTGPARPPRTAQAPEPHRHQGARTARRTPEHTPPAPGPGPDPGSPEPAAPAASVASEHPAHATPEDAAVPAPAESPAAEARRRELATLAWPEAAGTTPEQREALELAVRHRLAPRAVAAVLGLEPAAARELLAGAACEVERTRAALAVVETGGCPTVARLTGDHRVLLSAALRRELVRHVDDCPRCRRAAERADAAGPWPGAVPAPAAALPLVEAPRPSVYVAMAQAQRARAAGPRFDRSGFPLDPKDQAARRDRLRARVVTTTVVATVVAAPVIALWAAYRGAPLTGEGHDGTTVTATEVDGAGGMDGDPAKNGAPPGDRFGARAPDVSAEVVSVGGARHGGTRLTVTARTSGTVTTLTLTAAGGKPVTWSAAADAHWLRLSRTSGTLAAGRSTTVAVSVIRHAQPVGPWRARISLTPSDSAVLIDGYGGVAPTTGGPRPTRPATHAPRPTDPGATAPGPTGPGPTAPGPTDPGPTEPGPGPTDPTDPPGPTGPPGPTDPPEPTPGPTGPTDPAPTDPAPTAPDPTTA
ncbi:hypothetical protein A3L22_21635 [Streptomyces griseus subsp. griseus]|nr:hypothetical protein A3L22_21635 [Streptomyces griseus subsp. griseus]